MIDRTVPSGQFMAAGPLAFDVKNKRGICLQGDGNRKTITVASIRDDGTAYGAVDSSPATSAEAVTAQLSLTTATGEAKVLTTGTQIPYLTMKDGTGLFITRNSDNAVVISLRPAR